MTTVSVPYSFNRGAVFNNTVSQTSGTLIPVVSTVMNPTVLTLANAATVTMAGAINMSSVTFSTASTAFVAPVIALSNTSLQVDGPATLTSATAFVFAGTTQFNNTFSATAAMSFTSSPLGVANLSVPNALSLAGFTSITTVAPSTSFVNTSRVAATNVSRAASTLSCLGSYTASTSLSASSITTIGTATLSGQIDATQYTLPYARVHGTLASPHIGGGTIDLTTLVTTGDNFALPNTTTVANSLSRGSIPDGAYVDFYAKLGSATLSNGTDVVDSNTVCRFMYTKTAGDWVPWRVKESRDRSAQTLSDTNQTYSPTLSAVINGALSMAVDKTMTVISSITAPTCNVTMNSLSVRIPATSSVTIPNMTVTNKIVYRTLAVGGVTYTPNRLTYEAHVPTAGSTTSYPAYHNMVRNSVGQLSQTVTLSAPSLLGTVVNAGHMDLVEGKYTVDTGSSLIINTGGTLSQLVGLPQTGNGGLTAPRTFRTVMFGGNANTNTSMAVIGDVPYVVNRVFSGAMSAASSVFSGNVTVSGTLAVTGSIAYSNLSVTSLSAATLSKAGTFTMPNTCATTLIGSPTFSASALTATSMACTSTSATALSATTYVGGGITTQNVQTTYPILSRTSLPLATVSGGSLPIANTHHSFVAPTSAISLGITGYAPNYPVGWVPAEPNLVPMHSVYLLNTGPSMVRLTSNSTVDVMGGVCTLTGPTSMGKIRVSDFTGRSTGGWDVGVTRKDIVAFPIGTMKDHTSATTGSATLSSVTVTGALKMVSPGTVVVNTNTRSVDKARALGTLLLGSSGTPHAASAITFDLTHRKNHLVELATGTGDLTLNFTPVVCRGGFTITIINHGIATRTIVLGTNAAGYGSSTSVTTLNVKESTLDGVTIITCKAVSSTMVATQIYHAN